MRVAVLGTGLMGAPLARRLASQGYAVSAWNRSAQRAAKLVAGPDVDFGADSGADSETGSDAIDVVDEPLFAVADAEAVILTLTDYPAINDVLLGPSLRSHLVGRTVIQMGTIAPAQSSQLGAELARLGADYLEAPVLGSIPEARQGTLLLMVGGELVLFQRWLPLLRAFGPKPMHIGAVGQAATVKLALNQLIAGMTSSFASSLGLVREAGIDVEQFMAIVRDSALYAPTFDKKLARMLERDYAKPNFPLRHLLKDVNLFLDAAGEAGLDIAPLLAVREILEDAEARGLGDEDYSALYESIHSA